MSNFKCLVFLPLLFMVALCHGQSHIYNSLSTHPGIEAAYIDSLQIDSSLTVNVTILIVHDSVAWSYLFQSFSIPQEFKYNTDERAYSILLRDKHDLCQFNLNLTDNYLIVIAHRQHTFAFYQYDTREQYRSLLKYTIARS